MNYNNNDNGLLLFLFILFLLFSLSMNGQGDLARIGIESKSDTLRISKIGKCRHSQYRLEQEGKDRSIYKSSSGESIIITKPPSSADSSSTSIGMFMSENLN